MACKLAVLLLSMVCLGFIVGIQSESCKLVKYITQTCITEDIIHVNDRIIKKGDRETKRIKLPGYQKQVRWYCGSTQLRFTTWNAPANQVRIRYLGYGSVDWSVYDCSDLSGPTKAGLNCAVIPFESYCPSYMGTLKEPCVFEVIHLEQKTETKKILGDLKAKIVMEAGLFITAKASASAGVSYSTTEAKEVYYGSHSYYVIAPGFSLCAFSNNTSVRDFDAPTGFQWQCHSLTYVQKENKAGARCTSLAICEEGVCEADEDQTYGGTDSLHLSSIILMLFSMTAIIMNYLQ